MPLGLRAVEHHGHELDHLLLAGIVEGCRRRAGSSLRSSPAEPNGARHQITLEDQTEYKQDDNAAQSDASAAAKTTAATAAS